jgi:anti-anti-sigma factor
MDISLTKQGHITIIELNGQLDTMTYIAFENQLLDEILPGISVLIDCSGLDYISSSGLRVLILAFKKAEKTGSKMALCSLQPRIMEVFKIAGFVRILSIYADRQSALFNLKD